MDDSERRITDEADDEGLAKRFKAVAGNMECSTSPIADSSRYRIIHALRIFLIINSNTYPK